MWHLEEESSMSVMQLPEKHDHHNDDDDKQF